MKDSFSRRVIAGALLLIPLVFMAFVLNYVFHLALWISTPISVLFPIDSIADAAIANVIAVILVIAVCFFLGLLARSDKITGQVNFFERFLERSFPTYRTTRMAVSAALANTAIEDNWRVVLIGKQRSERYIGYEIEVLQNGDSVVFQPSVPDGKSGFIWTVPQSEIEHVKIEPRDLSAFMKDYGLGISHSI